MFAETLQQQRLAKMKGGIYHLTQVQLAYNSNRIEGSQLTEEQTRYLYETRTVSGDALVDDVIETDNHFRAFDDMLTHVGQPITADTMK
ncbi:MAG: cell filamentation protein Fic, partial [Microbacterium sp. 13-71-7]